MEENEMVCISCGFEIEGDDLEQPCPLCRKYGTLRDKEE